MRAAVFDRPGMENLKVKEVDAPRVGPHDALVRVVEAGVNPVDNFVVSGARDARPMPHTPGAEFVGVVEDVGEHVEGLSKGDVVVDYPRVFCGTCDMCMDGQEMLCRVGGVVGTVTNGGFAEYVALPSKSLLRVGVGPGTLSGSDWDLLASLPVSALTAYHALRMASVGPGSVAVVMGAAGNTGMFAVQLSRAMGARVIAVSRSARPWLAEMGASSVVEPERAAEAVAEASGGSMADVVVDPIGEQTIRSSVGLLGPNGRLVSFGTYTGPSAQIDMRAVYAKQIRIIGSTGGTRRELLDLIRMAREGALRVKVWRRYGLERAPEALAALRDGSRDGRAMISAGRA